MSVNIMENFGCQRAYAIILVGGDRVKTRKVQRSLGVPPQVNRSGYTLMKGTIQRLEGPRSIQLLTEIKNTEQNEKHIEN
jgi:hypothetical protein